MEKMDKLFSEKLVSYEKAAPAGAWTKIEHKLDRRKDKLLWLRIAAGVSIFAIASILIFRTSIDGPDNIAEKENQGSDTKEQRKETRAETPAAGQLAVAEQPVARNTEKEQTVVIDQSKQSHQVVVTERMRSIAKVEDEQLGDRKLEEDAEGTSVENVTSENITAVTDNAVAMIEEIPAEEPVRETDNAITLVYSAEEVNSKYLNKDQNSEATSDDKKPSTLRKLLDKAYDLKHNQDPFGELRQKKNEILALNFKNEKERSQNR